MESKKIGQYSISKKTILYLVLILSVIILYLIFTSDKKINKDDINDIALPFPVNLPGGV